MRRILFDSELAEALASAQTLEQAAQVLQDLMNSGVSVWTDGSLYMIKGRVEAINGLAIYVNANDHNPPHFHVMGGGLNARFRISDGTPLKDKDGGQLDSTDGRLIEKWFKEGGKDKVTAEWGRLHPTASR